MNPYFHWSVHTGRQTQKYYGRVQAHGLVYTYSWDPGAATAPVLASESKEPGLTGEGADFGTGARKMQTKPGAPGVPGSVQRWKKAGRPA